MTARRKTASKAPPSAPVPEGGEAERFHIERYHSSRNFALYDGTELVVVTVYLKGAKALKTRLETDARTLADQQRQIDALQALTPRFRELATETYRPPEQLPLLAAEDIPVYRRPSSRKPAPRREI